jgi:hypothetical protein
MVTKEKAIEILEVYKAKLTQSCSNQLDEDIKAFDMAINTLKKSDFFVTSEYESNKEIKLNDPMWNIEQIPYIEPKIRGTRYE